MGQYWFARWHLSSSVIIVCNIGGKRVGRRSADTPQQASSATYHYGDTLFIVNIYQKHTAKLNWKSKNKAQEALQY